MRRLLVVLTLLLGVGTRAPAQTEPATAAAEGPITATITGVNGNVSVRSPGGEWRKATVGMQLNEGDEIRTALRAVVQFVIPPDQTITIDRLSTIQLVRQNFENGKFNTDIGLKYGRMKYDIESAGREHDAKVRSPSSVLAIRGTQAILYDQPPFTPEAQSITGRVFFRDARKQVTVGTKGGRRAKVNADRDNAAQTGMAETAVNTRTSGSARSNNDNQLGITIASFQQPDLQVGVFEIVGQAQNQAVLDSLSVIGVIQGEQLSFQMGFSGSPFVNVDFVITGPTGDVVDISNFLTGTPSPAGGKYVANDIADASGIGGFDDVTFDDPLKPAPPGTYTVQTVLTAGTQATVDVVTQTDRLSENPGQVGPVRQNLTTQNPSLTFPIILEPKPADSGAVPQRKRKR